MNQHHGERMTVHDAARRLGISEDAVRMRVKRGKLEAERERGRLYVLLDLVPTTEPTDRTDELIAELRDRVRSLEHKLDQEREARTEERRRADTVIAQLSAANAEQARTIRAIEAPREPSEAQEPSEMDHLRVRHGATEEPFTAEDSPQEPSESPETAADEQQGRSPISGARGPQEGTERPWWRRLFT